MHDLGAQRRRVGRGQLGIGAVPIGEHAIDVRALLGVLIEEELVELIHRHRQPNLHVDGTDGESVARREERLVLEGDLGPGLEQREERDGRTADELEVGALDLRELNDERLRGEELEEEVVHVDPVGRGEVVLGLAALEHRRGLGLEVEEVDNDERGRAGVAELAVFVERCLFDPHLDDILVGPEVVGAAELLEEGVAARRGVVLVPFRQPREQRLALVPHLDRVELLLHLRLERAHPRQAARGQPLEVLDLEHEVLRLRVLELLQGRELDVELFVDRHLRLPHVLRAVQLVPHLLVEVVQLLHLALQRRHGVRPVRELRHVALDRLEAEVAHVGGGVVAPLDNSERLLELVDVDAVVAGVQRHLVLEHVVARLARAQLRLVLIALGLGALLGNLELLALVFHGHERRVVVLRGLLQVLELEPGGTLVALVLRQPLGRVLLLVRVRDEGRFAERLDLLLVVRVLLAQLTQLALLLVQVRRARLGRDLVGLEVLEHPAQPADLLVVVLELVEAALLQLGLRARLRLQVVVARLQQVELRLGVLELPLELQAGLLARARLDADRVARARRRHVVSVGPGAPHFVTLGPQLAVLLAHPRQRLLRVLEARAQARHQVAQLGVRRRACHCFLLAVGPAARRSGTGGRGDDALGGARGAAAVALDLPLQHRDPGLPLFEGFAQLFVLGFELLRVPLGLGLLRVQLFDQLLVLRAHEA
mmetsp:Transcript_102276/g.292755  ORF Transcript_102276/g.292755 Transcript_102276/m.292755 type:complete len:711 (+) Transcript_102276:4649-6781(+)